MTMQPKTIKVMSQKMNQINKDKKRANEKKSAGKFLGGVAEFGFKIKLLVRGLILTIDYKLWASEGDSFSDYLLTKVRKRRNFMDARFSVRLFMSEMDTARLSEISKCIDGRDYTFSKREWMALIESRIWEKGGNVAQLIENSGLDESTKRSYESIARFYSGNFSGSELIESNFNTTHTTWLWFLPKLITVYALCESGHVEQGEKVLKDVIKRDPKPFIEFQDRFECTGYRKYHIPGEG